jgi:hypothetical protein
MDHIVWLDAEANELNNLVLGKKSMIIRGADNRMDISGDIAEGETLYLVSNEEETKIKATARVKCIFFSEELTIEESFETIIRNQDKLQLPDPQFDKLAGKKFLGLIELSDVKSVKPVTINCFEEGTGISWLTVGSVAEYTSSIKI